MQVNTNVYGAPDTWLHVLPSSGYYEENTNLIPAWQTINGGITVGKITLPEPLDNSFTYAAIANDAPAAGITVCKETEYQTAETQIFDKENILPLYMNAVDNGQYSLENYDLTTNKDIQIYSPNTQLQDNNLNYYVCPLVSMSPKDIVLHIGVWAYSTDWSTVTAFNADDYINSYATTYPHIIQIFASVYTRNDTDTGRNVVSVNYDEYGGFYFGRDVDFECPTWGTIRDYAMTFQHTRGNARPILWGLCNVGGRITNFNSANYVHKFIGSGGTVDIKNGELLMYRDFTGDDWIQRVAASYGVFFTLNYATANNGALNDNKMFLGVIDEQGLCHGDYTYGTDNETQPQYNWTSTNDSTYNPDAAIDKNTYSTQTTFNVVGDYNGMVNRYVLNGSAVRALSTSLWAVMGDLITDAGGDYANLEGVDYENFLTANPMDCIIDLRKYPFKDIPAKGHWDAATQKNINFGKKASSAAGYEFNYTMFEYAFSNVDIFPRFGNCFLDYAPYTTMELYVPFCGTVELNPADFMGHTLKVFMEIDYTTGTCVTYICADSLVIKSVNGTVAIDIPVSGTNSARIMSNLNNAVVTEGAARASLEKAKVKNYFSLKGAVAGSMDLYTGGQFGVTGKLNKAMTAGERWTQKGAEYNLTHQEQPVNVIKSCSSAGGWAIDLKCRLIIYYPDADFIDWINNKPSLNLDKLSTYAHLNGFACLENKTLDNFSGYAVISEIDLSNCSASETEKQLIKGLLQSGVYL